MVPADAGIKLQAVFLLVVQVEARHFRCCQTLSAASETTTAARESHIVDIIGTQGNKNLQVGALHTSKDTTAITMTGSCRQVGIHHISFIHTPLDTEVQHGLLLTIVDTTDTGKVTLLVISPHPLNDRRRQVFHCRLRVTRHELLTVNQDFLHFLTIDGHLTSVIHLCARQFTHQFLYDRSFWGTIS